MHKHGSAVPCQIFDVLLGSSRYCSHCRHSTPTIQPLIPPLPPNARRKSPSPDQLLVPYASHQPPYTDGAAAPPCRVENDDVQSSCRREKKIKTFKPFDARPYRREEPEQPGKMVQLVEVEDEHFQQRQVGPEEEDADFTDTGTFTPSCPPQWAALRAAVTQLQRSQNKTKQKNKKTARHPLPADASSVSLD